MAKQESNKDSTLENVVQALATDNSETRKTNGEEKQGPLYKFFLDGLKDVYYVENVLIDALKKLEDASTTEELKDAFEDHRLQTKKHVSRIEKIFSHLDEEPEQKECAAINGIITEAEEIIKSTPEGSMTRDAALIIAAQKAEHYEIATYGGLAQIAITMGWKKVADLLEDTLDEEEETDLDLTEIAEAFINLDAEMES
ncbi:DUF892 family protein [Sphingobacterium daejeonense]|uniref:DUF892 family protein n=1 Tax=Sphingobacterium daejeonense TaxID=371142 RepID=UPI0010C29149|nr:DUF892 family protein [Sphingobacterium daejeonense]VTQ08093.1 Domain of uncharacterised function (DUF892) [Sphingobacterium daejeonense]